jgi:hypothetical protein
MQLVSDRAVVLTIAIYSIFSFAVIGLDGMTPLYGHWP